MPTLELSSLDLPHRRSTWLGRRVLHVSTCGSTNDLAWAQADAPDGHGLVILTDAQTAGRGRRGRSWQTRPGDALLFSTVLRDPAEGIPSSPGLLGLTVALGVAEGLDAAGVPAVDLRWPNDLEIDGRKIGGVLCERRSNVTVAGVGVNLFSAPADGTVARPTGAIADFLAHDAVPLHILADVLAGIEACWARWASGGSGAIVDAFSRRCVTLGRTVGPIDSAEGHGTAEGIDLDGRLMVRTARGLRVVSDSDSVTQES